jgi:KipI family sensor histidine kinase inhibitor
LFRPQGEAALLAYLGQGIELGLNARVHALAGALKQTPLAGVAAVLAAYCCLQVQFDPLLLDHRQVQDWVSEATARLGDLPPSPGRRVEVPVVYGGEHGPDLDFVAKRAGLTREEVIARHAGRDHPCFLVGFTPGFPFLGGLDPALAAPRLDSPRSDLPAGAVGIGGDQTGLYPLGGPGGWRILGRSPLMVYDPRRDPACLIQPGDMVRFLPIAQGDFPAPPPASLRFDPRSQEALKVLAPGAFSTVQDQGRWGAQDWGVPVSGALDQFSLAVANALVGNPPQAAALELTLLGPKLKALAPTVVAICGADLGARLDGQAAPMWQALPLKPGQVLDFRGPKSGSRAVLAVAGGLAAEELLGSRSTYPLGRLAAPLEAGMVLRVNPIGAPPASRPLPPDLRPAPPPLPTLRVVLGPNQDFFTPQGMDTFLGATYRVSSQADRRGARLTGEAIQMRPRGPTSIVSEPNTPGIVQVPPDGQPMILLKEQTIGGYAKAATVIGPDLDLLARAWPGQELRFAAVDLGQARAACRKREALLARVGEAARS